jgi:hypothetical protein
MQAGYAIVRRRQLYRSAEGVLRTSRAVTLRSVAKLRRSTLHP